MGTRRGTLRASVQIGLARQTSCEYSMVWSQRARKKKKQAMVALKGRRLHSDASERRMNLALVVDRRKMKLEMQQQKRKRTTKRHYRRLPEWISRSLFCRRSPMR